MQQLLPIILLLLSAQTYAQVQGRVIDARNLSGVAEVLVANKRTGETSHTDSMGYYRIRAMDGDLLFLYRVGYSSTRLIVRQANGVIETAAMKASGTMLDEVVVSGSTYKMDSIERSIIYRKVLNDANEKVKMYVGFGIGFNGLIGKMASLLTGREKRVQHFKKQFVLGEQDKFIATRYTSELVKRLTGLEGEAIAVFMNANPMPYDYARAASELELQMWIRDKYKRYHDSSRRAKGQP